jgi:type I restriction enzyme S subunit
MTHVHSYQPAVQAGYCTEAPAHWSVIKLKRLFSVSSGDFLAPEDETDVGFPVYGGNGIRGYAAKPNCSGRTLLIGRVGAYCGNVYLVDGEFWYSEHALRVFPIKSISLDFFKYLIQVIDLNQFANRTAQPLINSSTTTDRYAAIPPLSEQRHIAVYLDASCAAIDAAVAAKRRQLATLDAVRESLIESAVTKGVRPNALMRSVNEDWITEIPAHWEVCRIKRIVSRVDYGISESTEPEGRYPVLKMGHIQRGEIEFRDLDFVDEVSDDLLLETGDLLYNRTNSPDQVGKAAIFRRRRTDEITFASYLVRLRTNHRADPYFLNYLVNSSGFLSLARKLAIPSVQQSNLNSTRYCRMLIPRPPIEEQREIAVFLDAKLGALGRVVTGIESQIATLTVYRKSLIHECVTGQRQVTEADVARVRCGGSESMSACR